MGRYTPRTYEQLMRYCDESNTSNKGVMELLRYFADVRGTGMQNALDYVAELFENGTIQKIKEIEEFSIDRMALRAMAEWVAKSDLDVCQICANYLMRGDFTEAPCDDEEPCPFKRAGGVEACRNGIIKHFEYEVEDGKS